jgi:hypothetical protein
VTDVAEIEYWAISPRMANNTTVCFFIAFSPSK